ncbi:MAG: MiaB/RimO family radical SAM methylthiotransferase [Phycisphaerae bacterium]|nr:MiaB/RimO family radical SAM methylthiotransferase [Phycisphaerae bacterium]
MRYFTITTLGCKVNQYDAQAVAEAFRRAGWSPAGPDQPPDLVLVNTCCVTAVAMRKSRQAIRRAVRRAPGAAVWVMGCYGAVDRARLHRLLRALGVGENLFQITGNHDDLKACVSKLLGGGDSLPYETTEKPKSFDEFPDWEKTGQAGVKPRRKRMLQSGCVGTERLEPLREFADHQRAFVKVQDGCDAFCNYCIVPYARPRVWSRREEDILEECQLLVNAGHKEIVLCGVFLGAFGRVTTIRRKWDAAPSALPRLVRRVSEIPGLWRVRLSSLEPGDLSDELIAVLRDAPSTAPHLHLPLQSGSDKILRRMNRQYRSGDFRDAVKRLRDALDRPAVTTDIIVGYPGETDDDFRRTLTVAEEAGFAKIHIFPFSPLEPTGAWQRRNEIPPADVVKDRLEQLSALETQLAQTYRNQFIGQSLEGVVEKTTAPSGQPGCNPAGRSALSEKSRSVGRAIPWGQARCTRKAMTDRYLTVEFPAPPEESLTGLVVTLRITGITREGLKGNPDRPFSTRSIPDPDIP